ncbi:hypothetical protein [Micromonospora inositola]|nr:hypothetical protein [Micromonospora inositola]
MALLETTARETRPPQQAMAATLVAALPMLGLFMVFGRRIVNSIGFSGIK